MQTVSRHAHCVTCRGKIAIAFVALVIALMSSHHAGLGVRAASVASVSLVPVAAKEPNTAVRSFRINVPETELAELRRRVLATRWPDKETVADQSQGIQLAKLQELVRYWGTAYDWRNVEARLNSLPQFKTTIDGVDIHFIHVRSRHRNALPVIITHGWPGSIIEQLKIIGPLTDPTARGGSAEDAFDVVIPSMPGYGFSGKPTETGWGPDRIAGTWVELMKRLGYARYVAQGGDWGSPVSSAMARLAPAGLLGIHINLPAVVPPEVTSALAAGGPAPAGLSEKERAAFDALSAAANMGNRSVRGDDGHSPADHRLRGDRLSCRSRGVVAWTPGLFELDLQQQRSRKVARRGVERDHSVLADEHCDFSRAAVLGVRRTKRDWCGRGENRRDPASGGHHSLSWRDLSSSRDLGPTRVSQPDLLPRSRPGRSFRGVGATAVVFGRGSSRVQIIAEGELSWVIAVL